MPTPDTRENLTRFLYAFSQRLLGLTLILGTALFFAGPPLIPQFYWAVVLCVHVFLVTNAVRLAVGMVITSIKTRKHIDTDWNAKYAQFAACQKQKSDEIDVETEVEITPEQVRQIIIIPNYKEEFETLCETLETLGYHEKAQSTYIVILAMEEGEEGCNEKAGKLKSLFANQFLAMHHTVHPKNIPGEARGKSSNVAWAAKYFANNISTDDRAMYEILTVMDADTHLSAKYFECLTFRYCTASFADKKRMLFAPTLIFDRNANAVPFVVRLADICWSIGLISNFQLPVKFPCSVYTLTRMLAHQVNYWDAGPEAIGEDMHMALKCWTTLRMELKMFPIYIPASCSNVQADTYFGSVKGRFEQSKRHLWGALDFGYTFASLIARGCYTKHPVKSLLCIYLLFEIFFQPYFGFYHLSGQLIYASKMTPFGSFVIEYTTYIRLALIPPALIVAFAYERYHYLACHYRAMVLRAARKKKTAETVAVTAAEEGEVISASSSPDLTHLSQVQLAIRVDSMMESDVAFRKWFQVLDWAGLPFCLVFYYMIPGVNAMLKQMFTNRLDYKVSLKPTTRVAVPKVTETSEMELGEIVEADDGKGNECDDHGAESDSYDDGSNDDSLDAGNGGASKNATDSRLVRVDSGVEMAETATAEV